MHLSFYLLNLLSYLVYYLIAAASLYRAVAFVHEIIHQKFNKQFQQSFVLFWNLTAGLLALMPSPTFNAHLEHHAVGKFGTKHDPQYPLIKSHRTSHLLLLALFVFLPLLTPLINLVRVLLTPIDETFGTELRFLFYRLLYKNQSFSDRDLLLMHWLERYYFLAVVLFLMATVTTPKLFFVWYAISVGGWWLSALRIPLEHSLVFYRKHTNLQDQITDSYDRERSLFSFIVQPLNLRLHRQHHANPSLPYYRLK